VRRYTRINAQKPNAMEFSHMDTHWLASLDEQTRLRALALIDRMRAWGAPDPESWVYSEVEENIAQSTRFLVLRTLWRDIDAWRDRCPQYVPDLIAQAAVDPTQSFADAGIALKRMIDAGISFEDIGAFARMVAYESVFTVLERIDAGHDHEVTEPAPRWELVELDEQGVSTGRSVGGLHENILSLDPTGREGRPA
jgi:hypothetical protein